MKFPENYIAERSIDWFGNIDGRWIMANSMGGGLPERVNDREYLNLLRYMVHELEDIVSEADLEYNDELIRRRYERAIDYYLTVYGEEYRGRLRGEYTLKAFQERYVMHFLDFAKKGFIACIRVDIDDAEDNGYVWVVRPKSECIIKGLDRRVVRDKIQTIVGQGKGAGFMNYFEGLHMNLFDIFNTQRVREKH